MENQLGSGGVAHGSADLSNVPGDAASVERLGRQISQEELDLMGEDQMVQLYELRKETTKPIDKPP